jgi:hypothetical protein
MSWSASKVFVAFMTDLMNNTTAMDLNTDALLEAALFDDTITPDATVSSANSAYGAGVWASGGQSSGTSWPALGRPLASVTSASASNVYKFDAADTVSADSSCTLSGAYGALVYDHSISTPVADQGICFNYFGGVASVTSGTFTVSWNASGIFTITV